MQFPAGCLTSCTHGMVQLERGIEETLVHKRLESGSHAIVALPQRHLCLDSLHIDLNILFFASKQRAAQEEGDIL